MGEVFRGSAHFFRTDVKEEHDLTADENDREYFNEDELTVGDATSW